MGCVLTFFQALILGIVQGITEFFPISSSAHLRLFKWLFNIPDGEHLLYFDLLCHMGTLLALILYLRKEIWAVLRDVQQIAYFTLALLPLIPGYFLLKPLRIALSDPSYLGYCFLFTGVLLWVASQKRAPALIPTKWTDVVWIGVMQTMALIPGISRSGSTIATARLRGWDWMRAAKFSFLLAVPTILGGEILETLRLIQGSSEASGAVSMTAYGTGFIASFCMGLFGVRAIFWIYEREKVRPLAWYCLGIGLISLAMFNG